MLKYIGDRMTKLRIRFLKWLQKNAYESKDLGLAWRLGWKISKLKNRLEK